MIVVSHCNKQGYQLLASKLEVGGKGRQDQGFPHSVNYLYRFSTFEGMQLRQQGRRAVLLPDERRRSSGIVICLLVIIFLSLFASYWHERQVIESVQINGVTGLSARAVQVIADSCITQHRSEVALATLRSNIERIPFVNNVDVFFSGVRDVTVEVHERIPVAHVVMGDGSLRLVDAGGRLLSPTKAVHAFNIPLLRSNDQLTHSAIKHAVEILNCAQSTLKMDLYQSVSEMLVEHDGSIVFITDRMRWRLGKQNIERASKAFADMNVFWSRISSSNLALNVSEIDLRWKHYIVVRSESSTATTDA